MKKPPRCVYFILAKKVGLVKIGHAKNAEKRFADLRTASPVALALLGFVRGGGRHLERHLHELFAAKRVRGEWFTYDDEIADIIRRLIDEGPTAIESPRVRAENERTESVTIWVTRAEKRAIQLVAAARGKPEGDMLREMGVNAIVAEEQRIRRILGDRRSA